LVALRTGLALRAAGMLALLGAVALAAPTPAPPGPATPAPATPAPAAPAPVTEAPAAAPAARVEARSAELLAVGTVRGDRMTIHLSRLADNAPVRDAALGVVLRGATHAAVAEADGSYSVQTPDLALPGAAAVQFQVTLGATRQDLQGTLQVADRPEQTEDKGSSRQFGWWVLNFAVCIGFLLLWRRRKAAASKDGS
jgi:membrane fusion protein, heavy metal efflux system